MKGFGKTGVRERQRSGQRVAQESFMTSRPYSRRCVSDARNINIWHQGSQENGTKPPNTCTYINDWDVFGPSSWCRIEMITNCERRTAEKRMWKLPKGGEEECWAKALSTHLERTKAPRPGRRERGCGRA